MVKKCLLIVLLLTLTTNDVRAQTEYMITPLFSEGQEFPSNTEVVFNATIYPSEPPITVTITTSWAYQDSKSTSGGYVEFRVKTPKSGSHWVRFSSEYAQEVTVPVNIVKAVRLELKYEQKQYYAPYYDPYPNIDILIKVKPQETDEFTGVTLDSLQVSSNNPILSSTYHAIGQGWYEVYITTDDTERLTNPYKIKLVPKSGELYSIPAYATVIVAKPIMCAKITIGDTTGWIRGSETSSMSVTKGKQNIYITICNSKNFTLPDARVTRVVLRAGGGKVVYDGIPSKDAEGRYIIPISLTDAFYELNVMATYGTDYVDLDGIMTISTYSSGFDILSFVSSPVILGIVIVIALIVIALIKKRRGSTQITGGTIFD